MSGRARWPEGVAALIVRLLCESSLLCVYVTAGKCGRLSDLWHGLLGLRYGRYVWRPGVKLLVKSSDNVPIWRRSHPTTACATAASSSRENITCSRRDGLEGKDSRIQEVTRRYIRRGRVTPMVSSTFSAIVEVLSQQYYSVFSLQIYSI
ncbi:hypothetical protein BC629DRAFT_182726 [Irpex lacteus]|nr:hypothetical protein BC629DRAFT_182726 [Irpex lacteus]